MSDDIREIERLIYAYAEHIDAGDFDAVAGLFANGRIEAAPGTVIEGRDAVLDLYERTTRRHTDGTPLTSHLTTNVVVDVSDDASRAQARSYFTVLQQTDALPLQPIIAGRYHDTFHRIHQQWWFDTRTIVIRHTGDLREHLHIDL